MEARNRKEEKEGAEAPPAGTLCKYCGLNVRRHIVWQHAKHMNQVFVGEWVSQTSFSRVLTRYKKCVSCAMPLKIDKDTERAERAERVANGERRGSGKPEPRKKKLAKAGSR